MYPHVFPDPEIFLKNIHTAIFHTTAVQDPKRTTLKKGSSIAVLQWLFNVECGNCFFQIHCVSSTHIWSSFCQIAPSSVSWSLHTPVQLL